MGGEPVVFHPLPRHGPGGRGGCRLERNRPTQRRSNLTAAGDRSASAADRVATPPFPMRARTGDTAPMSKENADLIVTGASELLTMDAAGDGPLRRDALREPGIVPGGAVAMIGGTSWARVDSFENGEPAMKTMRETWRRSVAGMVVVGALGWGGPVPAQDGIEQA